MTKKMEENTTNPFEGGLSMFGMNFASNGFSWAENLYQKWENICQNNIIVQEPSKIVDAVGEQVRKIYEEVTDDLLNQFSLGCDKAPISYSSLEQDVIADVCEESRISHDEGPINEGSLICPMSALAISSEEVSIAPLPDIQQDERKEACDLFNKKIAFTPPEAHGCSCSSEKRDNNEEVSNLSTSHSGFLPSADEVYLPEVPENMMEREFMLSRVTDPPEVDGNCNFINYTLSRSSEIRDNNGEVSNLSTSHSGSLPSADEVYLPEFPENMMEREFMLSHATDPPEEDGDCNFIDYTLSCSSEKRDDNEEVAYLSTSHSGSLPSADEAYLPDFPENMMEREVMLSHVTDPPEEDGNSTSREVSSFVQSFSTVPEQRNSLSEREASLSIMDIADKMVETNEEFEDISLEDFFEEKTLEDCWKEAESYELALISYRAMKNRSYKKKLRDAFTSRFCSQKKSSGRGASFCGDIEAELAKMGITSSSIDSTRVSEASNLLTLESYESDWELL